ncbi:hypothetical protein EVAR_5099_1 [Eumeta japonica]|uniref:Uncharacterized protein n=1 Tax=Eumeta variegata TaxID=151549 RepID=A0A4C1SWY3_EUMVA|nr:hypothetical protein EVAR_5099_1 [Eumeta japonica]
MEARSIWLTEFHLRLVYNVMADEDLAQRWTSEGNAELGLSFWLVVAACIAGFINIICVCVAGADARDLDSVAPALEEKLNGAIMLY